MDFPELAEALEEILHCTTEEAVATGLTEVHPHHFAGILAIRLRDVSSLGCFCAGCVRDLTASRLPLVASGLRAAELWATGHDIQEEEQYLLTAVRGQLESLEKDLAKEGESDHALLHHTLQIFWNVLAMADVAVLEWDIDLDALVLGVDAMLRHEAEGDAALDDMLRNPNGKRVMNVVPLSAMKPQ